MMSEKVFPSAKPVTVSSAGKPANGGTFPPTKAQLYGATRPAYRLPAPATKSRRNRGGNCCCRCCLWTTIILLIVIFLIAIAGVAVYVLYRPHRPSFSVSSFKISTLNLTSSKIVATKMNLNITAKNPNKKITFSYSPISISVRPSSDDIVLGTNSLKGFTQSSKSTTLLKSAIAGSGEPLDDESAKRLKAILSNPRGLQLRLAADTKVMMKLGAIKLPRVRVRVTCDGIKGSVPKGNSSSTGSLAKSFCKFDFKFKIWKWTI